MTGGAVLGLNELSKTGNEINQKLPPAQQIVQQVEPITEPTVTKRKLPKSNQQIQQNNNEWVMRINHAIYNEI